MKHGTLLGKLPVEPWSRHLFLCLGPDCADLRHGEEVWQFLKRALTAAHCPVLRSKAACLRVCTGGPWLLVYPEGVWYGGVTIERCERIVREHILEGRVITEWASLRQPLSGSCYPGSC